MKLLPANLGRSTKDLIYATVVFLLSATILYNQRWNLDLLWQAMLKDTVLWGLIGEWHLREFFCLGYGAFATLCGLFIYKWRKRSEKQEAPELLWAAIQGLRTDLSEFKVDFNRFLNIVKPVLTKKGIELQVDEKKALIQELTDEHKKQSELNEIKDRIDELEKQEGGGKSK